MLNKDYRDMLRALSDEKVEFLLIGAYALAAHGYPRATIDMDIWVLPSAENAEALLRALTRFGAPMHDLTEQDFTEEGTVLQIGVAPRRIDIITAASGLQFNETFARATKMDIEGIGVYVPSIDDLILNKRATARTKDLADVEALEALREAHETGDR